MQKRLRVCPLTKGNGVAFKWGSAQYWDYKRNYCLLSEIIIKPVFSTFL
jgi:hypothetical protein